ncbi:hypothetical protein ACFY15_07715 [Streptomyces sp. NPDC001373]|uniref:hypothetical protein n=1 Tax=Streptomyces sp. NPDC001373 TaxID=3364565 RepID=UPI00367B1F6A
MTAAVALTALTGCGGEADGGPLAALGLPKADDIAGIEKVINKGGTCRELEAGGIGPDAAKSLKEPSFGVKETATCKDEKGKFATLLLLSDMKTFQEANKKALESDPGFDTGYLVGQNFAVVPGSDDGAKGIKAAGLFMMSCNPKHKDRIPSGYKVNEELVKGCFVTDYLPS